MRKLVTETSKKERNTRKLIARKKDHNDWIERPNGN